MAILKAAVVVLLAFPLVACSSADDTESSDFPPGTTCGLDLQTAGASKLSVSPTASVACASQLSSGVGIDVIFVLTEGAVESSALRVSVDKGQTGSGFAALVGVRPRNAEGLEAAGCLAEITANENVGAVELGHQYRVTGEVRDDGKSDAGEDRIIIERLRFVASITWID